jgi:hypothetical protein
MARTKRAKIKTVEPPLLTNEIIDRYLDRAAETVKEVERQLQGTFKLPVTTLSLRIQARR